MSAAKIVIPTIKRSHLSFNLKMLPFFVTETMEKMKNDMISQLQIKSPTTSSNESKIFREIEQMARYSFDQVVLVLIEKSSQGGKMFTPTVTLLMANACNQSTTKRRKKKLEPICIDQYRIAIFSEMIHQAALIHDDVIDGALTRRGSPSHNAVYGDGTAILIGDYLLSRAYQILCLTGKPRIISIMTDLFEELSVGELMQFCETEGTLEDQMGVYLSKTYKKTASWFTNSCLSVSILAGSNLEIQKRATEYGKSLGMAYQLVDDSLDFSSSFESLGKEVSMDLKRGLATAPVILAARGSKELQDLMERKFKLKGDSERAKELVLAFGGVEKTRKIANDYAHKAAQIGETFPNGNGVADALIQCALSTVSR